MEVKTIKELLDDLLIIGIEGSMQRIAVRDPATARLLRLNMKCSIFNDVIKRELKEADSQEARGGFRNRDFLGRGGYY
jgi:hypothetical protein